MCARGERARRHRRGRRAQGRAKRSGKSQSRKIDARSEVNSGANVRRAPCEQHSNGLIQERVQEVRAKGQIEGQALRLGRADVPRLDQMAPARGHFAPCVA